MTSPDAAYSVLARLVANVLALPAGHDRGGVLAAVLTAWWPHEILDASVSDGGIQVAARSEAPFGDVDEVLSHVGLFEQREGCRSQSATGGWVLTRRLA